MKRAWASMGTACLLLIVIGCGSQNYEIRLDETIKRMEYQQQLDENLMPVTKGKLEDLKIYLRAPKNLAGPTQTFHMTVVEPGKYDLESSFIDQAKQESLHVLARVKRPKVPAKKGAPPPVETPRGEFNSDVVELVKGVYGVELDVNNRTMFKDDTERNNLFKKAVVDLNAKTIQLYLFGAKGSPYEVALVFEYPKAEANPMASKIKLCLESFAVGEKATNAFRGGEAEEDLDSEGSLPGPPI